MTVVVVKGCWGVLLVVSVVVETAGFLVLEWHRFYEEFLDGALPSPSRETMRDLNNRRKNI